MATVQQLQAKAQSKQDAVMKRQRALVYAFSEQLNRCTPKQSSSLVIDNQPDKSHWGWIWLERWMAARPWGNPPGAVTEQQDMLINKNEKVKTKTEAERHVGSSKKEGIPLSEAADCTTPRLQGSPSAREHQGTLTVVVKKDEKVKIPTDVERQNAKKENLSGSDSAVAASVFVNMSTVQKLLPSPPPPPPPPPPVPSFKRVSPPVTHKISSHTTQSTATAGVTCSETSGASDVTNLISSACATELTVATLSSTPDTHSKSSTCPQLVVATFPSTPDTDSRSLTAAIQPIERSTMLSMPNSHPKLPACGVQPTALATSSITPDIFTSLQTQFDSLSTPSVSNKISSSSFPPVEPCLLLQSASPQTLPSREEGSLPQQHITPCPPLCTYEDLSNGVFMPEENAPSINVDGTRLVDEAVSAMNEGEDAMDEEEPQSIDSKNDEAIQADALSETNGRCDASVVSVGAKSTEASSKHMASPGSKHEHQAECASPSVPSYMATTKSSKAKIRTLTSPKQKSDSPKQKSDSPKQKADSPKQKPDSATKRRHSLSALEGKSSPGTQRPILHVRAGSKGQLTLLKDMSMEISPRSDGDLRRHGK